MASGVVTLQASPSWGNSWGIYDQEHEVVTECEALKETVTSLSSHDDHLHDGERVGKMKVRGVEKEGQEGVVTTNCVNCNMQQYLR